MLFQAMEKGSPEQPALILKINSYSLLIHLARLLNKQFRLSKPSHFQAPKYKIIIIAIMDYLLNRSKELNILLI